MSHLLETGFYILRHGQSMDNANDLISGGGRDPSLTLLGIEQAKRAGVIFKKLSPLPVKIITSALKRTHETAFHVTGHDNFIQEAALNERYLGELDGKISEAEQKQRGALPGEELVPHHFNRVVATINQHLKEGELTLFVCHGGTIRRVLEATQLSGTLSVDNARIYYFLPVEGLWTVTAIGDNMA